MGSDTPIEQAVSQIQAMSRDQCIYELTHFHGMRLDFDTSFLNAASDERLRHILLAAVLTVRTRRAG